MQGFRAASLFPPHFGLPPDKPWAGPDRGPARLALSPPNN